MNNLFHPYLQKFALVFFDNILVYSPSTQDHLDQLRIIFQILHQQSFYANAKNCFLGQARIDYLGHIVTSGCVKVVTKKIMVVAPWPTPSLVKHVVYERDPPVLLPYVG